MRHLHPTVAIAALAAACAVDTPGAPGGRPCTDLFAFGLTVTVVDADTGQPLCGATVTAIDGDFEETLALSGDPAVPSSCAYSGAGERAGTYRVEAREPAYETEAQDGVVVEHDGCHVIGEQVTLELAPRTVAAAPDGGA